MAEVSRPGTVLTSLPGLAGWWRRTRPWRRYWLREPFFGGLDFGVHQGARALPTELCSSIGARLGVLNGQHRYHRVRRRAADIYTRLSPRPVTQAEAEAAALRCFENSGRVMLEFSRLDRLWAEGRIAVEGAEHLLRAREAGQPVIVMGLHLANWETIGPSLIGLGQQGFKAFYQPPPNRIDERIVTAARRRYGVILLRPGITATRVARRLLVEERGVLLVYADEERRGYICMPLFGRPIPQNANVLNIIRLAWASGAAVIPAYAQRLGGARFRMTYLPPVELAAEGSDPAGALIENAHRIDQVITPLIQAHLDHWYMLLESRDWPPA